MFKPHWWQSQQQVKDSAVIFIWQKRINDVPDVSLFSDKVRNKTLTIIEHLQVV